MADIGLREFVLQVWDSVFEFNVVMEVGHMLVLFLVIALASLAMLRERFYPRWMALLGVVSAAVAALATLIGVVVLDSSMLGNFVTFGVGLLPLAAWIVAVGVVMVRFKPAV
jgi:hypothetical protein